MTSNAHTRPAPARPPAAPSCRSRHRTRQESTARRLPRNRRTPFRHPYATLHTRPTRRPASSAKGNSGPAVDCLQQGLDYVDSAGPQIDNDFGNLTYNAVVH
ncbi:hypothetical protein ACFQ6N_06730 [Kitasatospora sp. NPDC056446]|uniref:hypothetical protein n=1 Tax=Kitasatospora sp. NPDC056446 TaxID=3345819 RepID=UPI0036938956